MKCIRRLLPGAITFFAPIAAHAANLIWNYSTGEGTTTTQQVNPNASGEYRYDWANEWGGFGTSPVYTIAPNHVGNWPGADAYNYATPPGDAKWTSLSPTGEVQNLGTYTFIYQFDNPAEATGGTLDMSFLVDDKVIDIRFNGSSIHDGGPIGSWLEVTNLEGLTLDLQHGTNTLEIVVENTTWPQGGQIAHLGLAATYQIFTTNPIPEPSTTAFLLAAAGVGLTFRKRRAQAPR